MQVFIAPALSAGLALLLGGCAAGVHQPPRASLDKRQTLSLDGVWEVAEGPMDRAPEKFDRKVSVPGLVSLAQPAFLESGPKVADRKEVEQKDPRRDAFWYHRTFELKGSVPAVATLKVSKAMFGTKVFLNGRLIGEHLPCFTPGYFDARPALRPGRNELVIRVGSDRHAVSRAVPSGFDFEKESYIPGIFDSVSLILSGTPHFTEVQAAPDLLRQSVKVQARLRNDGQPSASTVSFVVREAKSGRIVGRATQRVDTLAQGAEQIVTTSIPISGCQLWSPENPFLYELALDSGADSYSTRFGMREFKFDAATGRAMLNGKPYFLRGSNITLYRFFEDPACKNLPWRESWVRRLHQRVKDMNWNCLRYCIGFPPENWYRIADEEGILIQDEFPIWFGHQRQGKWPEELKTPQLATEYAEWMRERWNHPCVVVWDANNETSSDQTGPAIRQVRGLDLSARPWDNSYEYPAEEGDVFESHPYHFNDPHFRLARLEGSNPVPQGNPQKNDGKHAVVINEYGWLWLNRDGTPTTLTANLYRNLLGTNSTTAQRRHLYARYLAAETEFWRCHRKAAAVMHFTTLGYSRPDGQTSDHWLNIEKLEWEPEFYRYVKDSFDPVGLMIDFWKERIPAGSEPSLPVVVINDLAEPWSGPVTLRLKRDDRVITTSKQDCTLAPYGSTNLLFNFSPFPPASGSAAACFSLEAELDRGGHKVRSFRDFAVVDHDIDGLAYLKPAKASSTYGPEYAPARAFDGEPGTYWSSDFKDPAWLMVDLGEPQQIGKIRIDWERAFAKAFSVELSDDAQNWTEVYKTGQGVGGLTQIQIKPTRARFVRLGGTERATDWGYAVRELQVFPPDNRTPTPPQ